MDEISKLRQQAASAAEAAYGICKRIPNPGETREEMDGSIQSLALTSIALSLAANGLERPPGVVDSAKEGNHGN